MHLEDRDVAAPGDTLGSIKDAPCHAGVWDEEDLT
jgi:hypothetical protein